MEDRNVLSWGQALVQGYNPSLYTYQPEIVPIGESEAILDFKIWSNKTMGICLYFTGLANQVRFQIMVFRRRSDRKYDLENSNCEIDFATCPVHQKYRVRIMINGKGKISLKHVQICDYAEQLLNQT